MLSPRRDDAGFTLIELLIAVVILGVITVPLANLVIGVFANSDATSTRMVLSHDAQISASFFGQDVAGMGTRDYSGQIANGTVPFQQSVQLNAAYNADGHTCGTSATPVAALRLLADDWDDSQTPPVRNVDVVAYYLVPVGGIDELHRLKCLPSGSTDVVLAHNVDPATLSVTCSSTCTSTSVPQWVKLSFTVTAPSADPYPITLTGQRRQS
ncbi:MAG TPA: prepilin-type N-terminal cleavage/methylation domain-containing protein [Pseudonocardiaceae bacterium]|nr:prepilin-type N-terminal cleavage/methylation domain-containing protein [Pseudonocardiaceae bacterium]